MTAPEVSNPDGRIASHNLERTGEPDLTYLRGLSADPGRVAGCPATPDDLWSWNQGRARCQ
jgi:hypothetical protein